MEDLINRRIWHKDWGVSYFCYMCGAYKPEKDFYKNKRSRWGVDARCKLHFTKKSEDLDPETAHIKFSKIFENDFVGARELLKKIRL
jgi:FMN phosphatase YigB (HAD superfamily)